MDLTTVLAAMLASDGWRDQAVCRQTDPEIFFPAKGESVRAAKRVCQQCPVRSECLEHAIERRESDGVWGGTSPRERRAIARERTNRRPGRAA